MRDKTSKKPEYFIRLIRGEQKMDSTKVIDKKEKTINLLIDYLETITDTNKVVTVEQTASVPAVAEAIANLLSL